MSLPKFLVNKATYGSLANQVVSGVQIGDGAGRPRIRRSFIDPWIPYSFEWVFSKVENQYFRAFYETAIKFGSLPFLMHVVVDGVESTEREVYIIPKSLNSIPAREYVRISGQIVVKPLPVDDDRNSLIIEVFSGSSLFADNWLNPIVNERLPRILDNV